MRWSAMAKRRMRRSASTQPVSGPLQKLQTEQSSEGISRILPALSRHAPWRMIQKAKHAITQNSFNRWFSPSNLDAKAPYRPRRAGFMAEAKKKNRQIIAGAGKLKVYFAAFRVKSFFDPATKSETIGALSGRKFPKASDGRWARSPMRNSLIQYLR